ncbi:MAG: PKD domain-containing protein [Acidobacteria bacterium]|nr:PKD domain-containing protein [Acidobacteriota bacterium]
MLRSGTRTLFRLTLIICALIAARAQAQDDQPSHPPSSTIYGNTGLWKVFSAPNLPKGQVSFSAWYDRINRNPGFLTISTVGPSGAVGLTDWLELGINFEINKRILARRQDQLSFGQQALGFYGDGTPFSPPTPLELMPGAIIPQLKFPPNRFGRVNGTAGYFNQLPWVGSKLQGNGVGTATMGLKLNPLSEEQGAALGLSFRAYAAIPTHRSVEFLLNRPTQTGDWVYGSDVILTKYAGDFAELNFNAGFRAYQSPGDGRHMVLSDEVPLGFGFTIPRKTRLQLMGEITADIFVGAHTPVTTYDARDPVDGTIGFRAWLTRSLAISGGYRRPFNHFGGDKNGFIADITFSTAVQEKAPPTPPSLTCSADPTEINAGQQVSLSAQAVSATGKAITYDWTTTGGTIDGSGPTVTLRTDNLAPGSYTATVRATETQGLTADCSTSVTVREPPPPQPPTVSCSADRPSVQVGEIVNLSADARSPEDRPLTYAWTTTGGRVEGTGARVRFDTTGLQPGNYTISVRVTDDNNQSAECNVQVTVTAPPPPPPPPPPPQASKLNDCAFTLNSPRVDNVCKAKLDDVALRLRSEPDASVTIVGYADSRERNVNRLADSRANNTKTYLVTEKGIAESRVQVRRGEAARGPENRRVDIHLVPRGATFNVGTEVTTPAAPVRRRTSAVRTLATQSAQNSTAIQGGDHVSSVRPNPRPSAAHQPETGPKRIIIASMR